MTICNKCKKREAGNKEICNYCKNYLNMLNSPSYKRLRYKRQKNYTVV